MRHRSAAVGTRSAWQSALMLVPAITASALATRPHQRRQYGESLVPLNDYTCVTGAGQNKGCSHARSSCSSLGRYLYRRIHPGYEARDAPLAYGYRHYVGLALADRWNLVRTRLDIHSGVELGGGRHVRQRRTAHRRRQRQP